MNWIFISSLAYLFLAFSFILDKLLLKKRIPEPAVYAFYVAMMSSLVVFLIPFGVKWIGLLYFFKAIFSGIVFIWALVYFYRAVKKNEISRVAPLVGTITQISTFLISVIFLNQAISGLNLLGLLFLVVGGFLVSFDLPLNYKNITKGLSNSIESGFLLAVAYVLFDHLYSVAEATTGKDGSFITGFFWTRIGLVLGGITLLLVRNYRLSIKKTLLVDKKTNGDKNKNSKTIAIFVLNKFFGGSASVLINNAIFLGGTLFVQAMSSVQFVFVLLLATIMAIKYPDIFEEKLYFLDWVQKAGAIAAIGAGIVLISL